MKVKTFIGTHRSAVDEQVNDWLARSKVHVQNTSTPLSHWGWDAVSSRTITRRAVAIAISVWYDDPEGDHYTHLYGRTASTTTFLKH
jgi:hypothetical protein